MKDLPIKTVKQLLRQVNRKNNKAITTLYTHYQQFLFAFIRLQVADESVLDEIVQDVFLAIYLKPLAFNGSSQFSTWLCSIARKKVIDRIRSNKTNQELIAEDIDDSILEKVVDLDWNVTKRYEEAELKEIMLACIDKLSLSIREEMFWVFYQQSKVDEMANIQDCSVNTIKTRLYQSRKKVRHCLEHAYGATKLGDIL